VRPRDVVLDPPRLNRSLRIAQVHEPALVEALVPELAVEALDVGVLDGFPGTNELELDPALVRPLVEMLAGELRSVTQPEAQILPLLEGIEYSLRIRSGAPVVLEEVRVVR
jgi:hypothetical protein